MLAQNEKTNKKCADLSYGYFMIIDNAWKKTKIVYVWLAYRECKGRRERKQWYALFVMHDIEVAVIRPSY